MPAIIILHLSSVYPPTAIGGAEIVASILAETQAKHGHRVHACSLVRDPAPGTNRNGVAVRPLGARNPLWIEDSAKFPSPVRLANKTATVLNWRVSSEFGALLDDIRPHVLHTHSMVELPPAVWNQAARRGVPIVHTLHDYDLLCIRGALFKDGRKCRPRHAACRVLSAPKRAFHGRIDAVAAVSRTVLDTHLAHGLFTHMPDERKRVIWNPVTLDRKKHPRKPRGPGAPLRFGFLGRLVEEKGLGPLLQAFRRIPKEGWTLRIAGEGSGKEDYQGQSAGLPIHFEGFVDAARFLAEIDVLICAPLWDEPFGLTTLEAYAAGCRVIGSTAGITGELLRRVEPSWTVPAGDVEALAATLCRAIADGSALPPDRRPAVEALLEELEPDRIAQSYLDLYQAIGADLPGARRMASC